MANIRVTPEELDAQGKELIGYSDEIQDVLKAIETKINDIIDGWDGLAQDAYYELYQTMQTSLNEFPKLVKSLGEATQSTAKAFGDVDEQLRAGFQSAQSN